MVKLFRKRRFIICNSLVIILSLMMIQNSITAEKNQVFSDITVYPAEPTPLSIVSFNVGINKNITVEDVRLIAQECRSDICFVDNFNVSMNYTYSCCWAFYETKITLIHERATKIKYYVGILNNNSWYYSNMSTINFSIPINNNMITNAENKSTPGFELSLFVLSILLIFVIDRWKRNSGEKL